MAIIGSFKLGANGTYTGVINTLSINRKVRLVPTESTTRLFSRRAIPSS